VLLTSPFADEKRDFGECRSRIGIGFTELMLDLVRGALSSGAAPCRGVVILFSIMKRSHQNLLHLLALRTGMRPKHLADVLVLLACAGTVSATDLVIHFPDKTSISRKSVQYECDGNGAKIGVPAGPFTVEYINGGGNSLAIVPISGRSLIFSNVIAGSGARYTARQYIWWEAGGGATLYSESLAGKMQSTCHPDSAK